MDDVWTLVILSLAMLLGCYVSGIIPLAFRFTETKVKIVPVLGTGLLIGTALAVIIPEGVHVMYSNHHSHVHHLEKMDVKEHSDHASAKSQDLHDQHHHHSEHESDHEHEGAVNVHSLIGVALVAGFITMLLIDQLCGGGHAHSHSVSDVEHSQSGLNRNKITATIGLVIHAAADGIALGAAITMSEDRVTMIVFLAIMLHKAPAAFGLVSFLMHDGFEKSRIKRHLFAFSVSAPLLAIITYFSLSQQSKETLSDLHATGFALLFSAGTFLYVATIHVLPEVANSSSSSPSSHDGVSITREQKGFNKIELLTFVIGSAIPVFLAVGHKH